MKQMGGRNNPRLALAVAAVLSVCLLGDLSGQQAYVSLQGARTNAGWGGGLGLTLVDNRTLISAQYVRALGNLDLFLSANEYTALSMIQYGRRVIPFEGGFMALMVGPGFKHEQRRGEIIDQGYLFTKREELTTNSLGIGVELRAVTLEGPLGGTVALFGFLSRSEPFLGIRMALMLGGEVNRRRGE